MKEIIIEADYHLLGKVEKWTTEPRAFDWYDRYAGRVKFHVYVPIAETESFQQWMTDFTNAQVKLSVGNERHMEVDVSLNE